MCPVAQGSSNVMSAVVTEVEKLPQGIRVMLKQSRKLWKGAGFEDAQSGKLELGARYEHFLVYFVTQRIRFRNLAEFVFL